MQRELHVRESMQCMHAGKTCVQPRAKCRVMKAKDPAKRHAYWRTLDCSLLLSSLLQINSSKIPSTLPMSCALGISTKNISLLQTLQGRSQSNLCLPCSQTPRKNILIIPSYHSELFHNLLIYILLSIRLIRRRRSLTRTKRRMHIPTPTRSHTRMEPPILRLIIQIRRLIIHPHARRRRARRRSLQTRRRSRRQAQVLFIVVRRSLLRALRMAQETSSVVIRVVVIPSL